MAPLLPKMKGFNKSLYPFVSSSQNWTKMWTYLLPSNQIFNEGNYKSEKGQKAKRAFWQTHIFVWKYKITLYIWFWMRNGRITMM